MREVGSKAARKVCRGNRPKGLETVFHPGIKKVRVGKKNTGKNPEKKNSDLAIFVFVWYMYDITKFKWQILGQVGRS